MQTNTPAPRRWFPTDDQVEQWLDAHLADPADTSPLVDQLNAAADDAGGRMRRSAPYEVASGRGTWALLAEQIDPSDPHARHIQREAARAAMVAEAAGMRALCEHTDQIRPLVVNTDPPVVVCAGCLTGPNGNRIAEDIKALGHWWNFECDRCGAHVQTLVPVSSTLGHLTIVHHACRPCVDTERQHAEQLADEVRPVGRRHPCPCGSGRRYKNCCDRRTAVR